VKAGWESKTIGELAETGAGGTPLKSNKAFYDGGNIPWLLSGEVGRRRITSASNFITDAGLAGSSAKMFPSQSILVAMYGATAGEVGTLQFPAATNQAVCAIMPNEAFVPDFLYYYLLATKRELVAQAVGGAQPNISQAKIRAVSVPLPPLEEQQAIVDKLDRAFAGLETARANAEANLENAKELFQSILDKVIGNAVESPEARPLQDVTLKIGSGATPKGGKAAYKTEGIALVRSMNVHDLRFKHEGLAYIDEQQAKALQNVETRPDDVLINITGASIARCCIVDPDILQARVNQHVAILRPDPEQIESKYLELSLVSSTNKRRLLKDGDEAGATRQALTKAGLQAFKIGIPSLSVQRQVEEEVAILKVETDRLEEEYTRQLEDLDELKQSLLQKAFAGELT